MKIARHVGFVLVLLTVLISLPFLFKTDFGAAVTYCMVWAIIAALYATDSIVWTRLRAKKRQPKKKIDPAPVAAVDEDDRYR